VWLLGFEHSLEVVVTRERQQFVENLVIDGCLCDCLRTRCVVGLPDVCRCLVSIQRRCLDDITKRSITLSGELDNRFGRELSVRRTLFRTSVETEDTIVHSP